MWSEASNSLALVLPFIKMFRKKGEKFRKIIQAFLSHSTWPGTIHYHTMTFKPLNRNETMTIRFLFMKTEKFSIVILDVHPSFALQTEQKKSKKKLSFAPPQKRHYLLR